MKEKTLKFASNGTGYFPPKLITYELMPSADNLSFNNINSQRCENRKFQESYAIVVGRSKRVHKSIQRKDDQLGRSIDNSADFVIESKGFEELKTLGIVKLIFLNCVGL